MLQSVQEIDVHGMYVAIHHDDDGEADGHFSSSHHHDEEYEQLCLNANRGGWINSQGRYVMHLRKGDQQQIHRIEHELDTHEYDDGVAPCEYPRDPDTEKDQRQEDVIVDWHGFYLLLWTGYLAPGSFITYFYLTPKKAHLAFSKILQSFFPINTAPTIALRNNTLLISNGTT